MLIRPGLFVIVAALLSCLVLPCHANAVEPDSTAEKKLFAVEFRIGPNWDATLAPQEQAYFNEHSAHLRELRRIEHIVMGARYSDIGLLVFSATDIEAVIALIASDPSVRAGTFIFDVHPFNVFYPWQVGNEPE